MENFLDNQGVASIRTLRSTGDKGYMRVHICNRHHENIVKDPTDYQGIIDTFELAHVDCSEGTMCYDRIKEILWTWTIVNSYK